MTQPLGTKHQIPDKLYFKIGEVSDLVGVEPYVLRYWETEFSQISPIKSRTNQRLYKRQDVETIVAIRELLYDQKFTIDGAKRKLKDAQRTSRKNIDVEQIQLDLEPSDHALEKQKKAHDEIASIVAEMDAYLNDNH